ncbi:hypothetical protein LPB136_12545 [Tenacibaculum todarodis]|uniref:Uncharacterized protein n=1 Tax=Tenacibaculum todarodis TaxID=1850252 RepID=A0A1L3JLZ5_9FLAO|nr:hypothetical protein [Tenacibaculum todarodis]APG66148.1 hypothetical protein LPB136_12545 [Tenacibaculum todarodis]
MDVQDLGLASQVIVAVLSVFCVRKHTSSFYLFFCFYLIVVLITEFYGAHNTINYNKGLPVFNHLPLAAFLQFNLIALMYVQLIKDKKWIKIILILSVLLSVFCFYTYFKYKLFTYLLIFGCLNTSLFSFLYLRELLISDKILNYKKHLPFWISVGFLVFYLSSIPFFLKMPFMQGRGLFFLIELLIIVMNLFIIYGLLCSRKEVKY